MLQREEEAPVDAVVPVAGPQGAVHMHDPRAVRPPAPLPVLQSEQTRPQWVSTVHCPVHWYSLCFTFSGHLCCVWYDGILNWQNLGLDHHHSAASPKGGSVSFTLQKEIEEQYILYSNPNVCMGQSLMCCISPEDCKEHTCHSNAKGNHEMVTPDHRHKGTALTIIPDRWASGSGLRT